MITTKKNELISPYSSDVNNPHMYGNKVIWTNSFTRSGFIQMYDLVTKRLQMSPVIIQVILYMGLMSSLMLEMTLVLMLTYMGTKLYIQNLVMTNLVMQVYTFMTSLQQKALQYIFIQKGLTQHLMYTMILLYGE